MKKSVFTALALLFVVIAFPGFVLAADAAESVPGGDIVAAVIGWLPASWEGWVTFVVTVCAAVSAIWPRPAETASPVVRFLYVTVNALGFNAGRARNADDAAAKAAKL